MVESARMRLLLFLALVVLLACLAGLVLYGKYHQAGRAGVPVPASGGPAVTEPAPPAVTIPATAVGSGAAQAGGASPGTAASGQAKAGQAPANKVDAIIAEVNRLIEAKEYMSAAMTLQKFVMTEQLTEAEKAKLAELLLSFKAQVGGEMESLGKGAAPAKPGQRSDP